MLLLGSDADATVFFATDDAVAAFQLLFLCRCFFEMLLLLLLRNVKTAQLKLVDWEERQEQEQPQQQQQQQQQPAAFLEALTA